MNRRNAPLPKRRKGQWISSAPAGITVPQVPSVADAEALTGGLFEVEYLPTIDWDPLYVARIAADPNGKLEPTASELANSAQRNCILYVNMVNERRRSGALNRTSFMYTLDNLGYGGDYDVFDLLGVGNVHNDLGSRANTEATGYALIVHDVGREETAPLPDGSDLFIEKVDQAGWYQAWLDQAATSEAGIATLWLIGEDIVQKEGLNLLISGTMGVVFLSGNQPFEVNPRVGGQTTMTFSNGISVPFSGDQFTLDGGCPEIRDYDALDVTGTAVATHMWKELQGSQVREAAIVMNSSAPESWNTIMMSLNWFDIMPFFDQGGASQAPAQALAEKILTGVLPLGCQQLVDPTDAPDDPIATTAPIFTQLYQNEPNPFNPKTLIRFDLARGSHVDLDIFDVGERLVRVLVDQRLDAGRHAIPWDGLDDQGTRASSGVYFYRMRAGSFSATRKLVVLK